MPAKKKVSDEILKSKYLELNNIWKVAEDVGICGQSVWERLSKLGLIDKSARNSKNKFEDWTILKNEYPNAVMKKDGIQELADKLGRTKQFICRKAKELGLTNLSREKQDHISELSSKRITKTISEKGHPKGMKGKKHSNETLQILSEKSKEMWKNPDNFLNSDEYRQMLSDRMTKNPPFKNSSNPYSHAKKGRVIIAETNYFYRSGWEANIAAYLEFLKEQKQILNWEYEVETFWFEKIKRGVRSYTPDFKITKIDGSSFFYEVKGWMDDKSKTKLKRMKIYYPQITIEIIDQKRYKEISKNKSIYKYWGGLEGPRIEVEFEAL